MWQRRRRDAIVAVVVITTLGVLTAVGWWAVTSHGDAFHAFLHPGGPCSEVEARLTDQLGADPMLAESFPDPKLDRAERFQPCNGWGSNYWGGAFVTRSYTSKPPANSDVVSFYAALGKANGWRMTADRNTRNLCGNKAFGGHLVAFILTFQHSSSNTSTGYTTSLLYAGQRQPMNECRE